MTGQPATGVWVADHAAMALAVSADPEALAMLRDTHASMRRMCLVMFGSDDVVKYGIQLAKLSGHDVESASRIVALIQSLLTTECHS